MKLDSEKDQAAEIASAIAHIGFFTALVSEKAKSQDDQCSTEIIGTAFALLKKCPSMTIYDALRASYDMWIKE